MPLIQLQRVDYSVGGPLLLEKVDLAIEPNERAFESPRMTVAGDPIDRVLRMIGLQLGADVERRGDSAIVRPSTRSVRPQ